MESKIEKIFAEIQSINITLASQHQVLKDHIRRTEILEAEIKPIQKKIFVLEALQYLLGASALIFGILESAKIINLF